MIKGKELTKIILTVCAFIAIIFSVIYIMKIFILKYNNLYLTIMTNYGIQFLMLVLALYLLNKFNYNDTRKLDRQKGKNKLEYSYE